MSSKKTVLLIADVKNWAFDNITQYLKKILSDSYNIHILYSESYSNPGDLLKEITDFSKIDFIHFFSRKSLRLLINHIATGNIDNNRIDKFLNITIVTSVPDHLYLQKNEDIISYQNTFKFVDNYYTTSKILNELYSNIGAFPKPWHDVIYDNVLTAPTAEPSFDDQKKLRITWVGNSAWGEWYFGREYDAKGYHTVIKPALALAALDSTQIKLELETNIVDGATRTRSKQEVFEILKNTDILLIAANTDGTPLPLIEAMSLGCAVIGTNTGIVAEVLPQIQQAFILERDPRKFCAAIKDLASNRSLLKELKQQNYESYKEIFLNDVLFKEKWSNFIDFSINRNKNENRIDIKKEILEHIRNDYLEPEDALTKVENLILNNKRLKSIFKSLLKINFVNYLARSIYFFLKQHKVDSNSRVNISGANKDVLVVYPTNFPGVKNSTLTLFHDQAILPITSISEYFALPNFVIRSIARKILNTEIKEIIFSGGGRTVLKLMDHIAYHKDTQNLNVYYLYHGSPAQWSEIHHLKEFHCCYNLYEHGKLKGIISLKKDLQIAFNKTGIKSYLLQNFIQPIQVKKEERSTFTIGLWGAYAIWVKNHYPQLVALRMLGKQVSTVTNFHFHEFDKWIQDKMNITIHPNKLPHDKLIGLIASTDLTLYVTNTECSPLIALESLGLGVPCLVGPSSGLYDEDEYLREMLTVTRVDCPFTIYSAIERVRANLEVIKSKLPEFIEKYNQKAQSFKQELLELIG